MTLLELSTRTHQNLSNPDSPTPGVIQYWYRHNIGSLNTLINSNFTINTSNGMLNEDMGEQEGAIYNKLYMIYYWDTKVRENLGAAAIDPVLEVAENGALVRTQSRNHLALSYIQMKKHEQEELNKLIHLYRMNNSGPEAIYGRDTIEELYDGVTSDIRTIDS